MRELTIGALFAWVALFGAAPALAMPAMPDERAESMAPDTREVADAGLKAKNEDSTQILETLERYAKAVNERDLPGLLAVYDPRASVKATINGAKRFYPLADYARALPAKFKEWETASARIQTFEVVRLRVSGNTAEVVVKAKGSRYFLSGTLEGRATLVKNHQDWKILEDDL
jgi:ketosteroid isomerase-like protein